MTFREDDRGAAIQIGAIILFGFIVLAIAGWQVAVVPQENARVEFTHNQRAQDDMQDVRNAIVSAPGSAAIASVGVDLAPEYPPRTIFVNPGPPSGTLRTVGTENASLNLTVGNATAATDDEAADFWDGSPTRYDTGGLAYEPGYNEFDSAPDTVYENSVLYNVEEEGTVVNVSGQSLVDGRTVTLVTLNGSLSRASSATYSLDFEALSTDSTTVSVTNTGGNVTISFASRRGPGWWNASLAESGELDEQGGHVVDVRAGSPARIGEFHNVTVELEGGVTYDLRMAKVGVGSGTVDPGKAYVVDVRGDGASVGTGDTQQLVVEVRDRYNNPVSGVTVRNDSSGTVTAGSLDAEAKTTGSDGRVTFEYTGSSAGTDTVVFNVSDDASPTARELASFEVAVTSSATGGGGGSGSAYGTALLDPSGQTGVTCDAAGDDCTVDASQITSVTLTADTTPTAIDATVDFGINNTSVGSISPVEAQTGASGQADTTFSVSQNGTAKLFASSGGSGDVVNLTVTNAGGGGDTTPPTFTSLNATAINDGTGTGPGGSNDAEEVDIGYTTSDNVNVDRVRFVVVDNGGTEVANVTRTVTDDASFTVTLSSSVAVNGGNDVNVTATVFDGAGNFEECQGNIPDLTTTITKSDFTCTTG